MISNITDRLDKIWLKKNQLEKELKILFQRIDCIPELENPDPDGSVILNKNQKSKLFKRMRYFKLLEVYKNIIMCCEDIGINVCRDQHGKHSMTKQHI